MTNTEINIHLLHVVHQISFKKFISVMNQSSGFLSIYILTTKLNALLAEQAVFYSMYKSMVM